MSTEVEKFRELVTSTEESIQGKEEAAARQLAAAQRLQDALLAAQKVSPLCARTYKRTNTQESAVCFLRLS